MYGVTVSAVASIEVCARSSFRALIVVYPAGYMLITSYMDMYCSLWYAHGLVDVVPCESGHLRFVAFTILFVTVQKSAVSRAIVDRRPASCRTGHLPPQ